MKNYSGSVGINWNWFTICLIGFSALLLMVLYFPGLRDIDLVILKTIRKFLEPYPSYIPVFFSNYGGVSNYIWPQITVTAVLISHQKYIKAFLVVFFTQGSYWLVDFIKDIICRERPCLHPGYSFPSGHTTSTACLCGIVIYLASRYVSNTFWKYFLIVLSSLLIFFVGLSRMWLGVHFLTDVLAGALLAFMLVNLFIILDKFFSKN